MNREISCTPPHFPDAERSDIIFIQILLADIYEPGDKQRMYERVVGNIAARSGSEPDTVLIAVTENSGPDWFAPSKDWAPPTTRTDRVNGSIGCMRDHPGGHHQGTGSHTLHTDRTLHVKASDGASTQGGFFG